MNPDHPTPSAQDIDLEARYDHDTRSVQALYEAFPYPPVPIHQPIRYFAPAYSYLLAQYARCRQMQIAAGKRALVAGCGTGHEIHLTQVMNPGLQEVIGVDLSQESIKRAQERIQYHQLKGCSAQVGNLMQAETLPDGPFDFIVSYGVVHHTADPLVALRNLADRLAPDGVMMLMLYNKLGRLIIYQIRQALQTLGIDHLSLEQKINFVQELFENALPNTSVATHAKVHQSYYAYQENLVDNLFHTKDTPFSIAEIPGLLDQADLQFIDIVPHPYYWKIELVIHETNTTFYEYYHQLPRIQQLIVTEALSPTRQAENVFWCCPRQAVLANTDLDLEQFKTATWQLNPLFVRFAKIDTPTTSLDQLLRNPQSLLQRLNTSQHHRIQWQLFPTLKAKSEFSYMIFTRSQLLDLLIPLHTQPKTGATILANLAWGDEIYILELFRCWERDRVVLQRDPLM